MNCESYILLLDEYLNNELEETLHGSVSGHLNICEDCRQEKQTLKLEADLYQKIGTHYENNFTDQWAAMRNRLAAESLIEIGNFPERKAVESFVPLSFLSTFAVWLNKFFFAKRTGVIAFASIVFAAIVIFLVLNISHSVSDESFMAATEPKAIFTPTSTSKSPEDEILQQKKSNESEFIKGAPSSKKIYQKSQSVNNKNYSAVNIVKTKDLKSQLKPTIKSTNVDSSQTVAARLPNEANNLELKTASDDKKLANYLNKVHLFLLMFRNLENAEIINQVIGDKYQIKAKAFLDNSNNFKKESLKNNDIPAAELLNEIEPVLKAIANLNNQSGKTELGNVTAIVKQTGIVFKMRLWMANAKSAKEVSL